MALDFGSWRFAVLVFIGVAAVAVVAFSLLLRRSLAPQAGRRNWVDRLLPGRTG